MKDLVEVYLSDLPERFLEGEEVDAAVHFSLKVPDLDFLFFCAAGDHHGIFFDERYLLNPFFVGLEDDLPLEGVQTHGFNVVIGEANYFLFLAVDGASEVMGLTFQALLDGENLMILFYFELL